jgi:predicted esterase
LLGQYFKFITWNLATISIVCALTLDAPSAQERFAEGDRDKRFFLIGHENRTNPPDGYRLLLVLPGGDGSADFHPFVRRIHQNALSGNYLVAQLVSKQWTPGQFEKLVWPTKINRWQGMRFSTEEFVDSVIGDIKRTHKIDPRHIYSLSWSSGGPAAYAVSLQKSTMVKGSFVAMSVFKPAQLPPLDAAKRHAYYILHSPQDFIPIAMAKTARDRLGNYGASVRLQTYKGGHGWHGDVFGMIRTGMAWLEQPTSTNKNRRPTQQIE